MNSFFGLFITVFIVCVSDADATTYSMSIAKDSRPALSIGNAAGTGYTPCEFTFNPAWIEPSAGTGGKSGLLVRAAKCPDSFGGQGDHIMLASCSDDGTCDDLKPIVLPFEEEAQDPRVVYDKTTGLYTLAYYASGSGLNTVYLRQSKTPLNTSSWQLVTNPQPWHRNGCIFPDNQHMIVGEAPPLPGLGLVKSTDGFKTFTMINSTLVQALGADFPGESEIVVEGSTPVVELPTGDFLHLYSAGTKGWVANGNYTAGFVIIDPDTMQVKQRSTHHVLIASEPFEGVPPLGPYPVQRYRTTFVTSIVPVSTTSFSATYRLWWGAADANVASGILTVVWK